MARNSGNGWGGARVGAGAPRKDDAARWLGGVRSRHGKPVAKPKGPQPQFQPPRDLKEGVREVWNRLAPHAFDARTLTRGTADAFRDLCEAVVVRDGLLSKIQADGYGDKEGHHPLLSHYRGMYQRVEAGMLKFRLAPLGKPMEVAEEAPADPFAEFDAAPAVMN